MRYYLATTAISEVWDLDSDLLLLGPWCLTEENKRFLEGRHYTLAENPWRPSAPKIKKAADYCHDIYEEMLPKIEEALNNLHSTSYPEKYWRVLLGPWLLHFIGVFYERYVRIQHALELYPGLYTHCLDGACEISSNDTQDFNYEVCRDEYNFRLFSIMCAHLGVTNKKISVLPSGGVPFSPSRSPMLRGFLRRMRKSVQKSLAFLANGPVALVEMYHLQPADYSLLSLKTGYRLFHDGQFHSDNVKFDYSPDMRARLTFTYPNPDTFIRLLYQMLPLAIPRCYIEGFSFYRQISPVLKEKRVVGSAVGWHFNERFKFSAAEAAAGGVRLVEFQHGGGFGNYLALPPEDLSLEKDVFYTWGWDSRAEYEEKLVKLPSPHLSKLKDSYSYSIDKILYVGTTCPRYHFRFHTSSLPEDFVSYLENTRRFLQNLPEGLKPSIFYRPHPQDYGWNIEKMVKDICPQSELLVGTGITGKLTDWMRKVRVCVMDSPSASYIEALSINVPCIFFWDHDVYVMRPEAERYFEVLRKAGILYTNPEEAASKLSEVFDDPWTWWRSRDVQVARNTFLERFGYSRKDWMEYWAEEIRSLASGKRFACEGKVACLPKE